MVGGDADAFEKVKPILDVMGNPEKVVRIGEAGAGQLCKVCNQMVIAGTLGVVAEAFALAKKSGIDAEKMREALLGGFASSRVLEVHGERILKGNFKPGFKTKLFAKDLKGPRTSLVRGAGPAMRPVPSHRGPARTKICQSKNGMSIAISRQRCRALLASKDPVTSVLIAIS